MGKQKKTTPTAGETRRLRRQQILFGSIAVLMILAMVVSLFQF